MRELFLRKSWLCIALCLLALNSMIVVGQSYNELWENTEHLFQYGTASEKIVWKDPRVANFFVTAGIVDNNGRSVSPAGYVLNQSDIENFFYILDERAAGDDPAYILLIMSTQLEPSNRTRSVGGQFKGSGTVLYRSDDYLLVLTAKHNIVDKMKNGDVSKTVSMNLVMDSKTLTVLKNSKPKGRVILANAITDGNHLKHYEIKTLL